MRKKGHCSILSLLADAVKTNRTYLLLLLITISFHTLSFGQATPKIKELESKRSELQKQISQSETLLRSTKKDVGSQLSNLTLLANQITERKKYINAIEADVRALEKEINSLQRQLRKLENDLTDRKKKYESSVKYLYKNKSIEEKLMFIFSAKTLSQTYRRMRYVQEYATYQRLQGEEIKKKQQQIRVKQNELRQTRKAKADLLKQGEREKQKLEGQEKEKKTILASLQKKQKSLQTEIARKRKQANKLNAQIDRLIEIELAKAKKRAEEEARREAAAKKKSEGSKAITDKSPSTAKKTAPMERYAMDKADRQLSGTFEKNRGLLPMPITGPYMVVSHYGQYSVEGLKNVKLDNKGIDIQGKPGAMARAIFDGEVSAIFQYNGLVGVLVRHGNYISVYCNLSSAAVSKGDKVKTKDVIGKIYSADGRPVLHFQLRKETAKLNPEAWLDK